MQITLYSPSQETVSHRVNGGLRGGGKYTLKSNIEEGPPVVFEYVFSKGENIERAKSPNL
jgi:hypothetical protein